MNTLNLLEVNSGVAKDMANYNLRNEDEVMDFLWTYDQDNQQSAIYKLCKDNQQSHAISKKQFVADVRNNGVQAFERLMCQFISGREREALTEVDSGKWYDYWKHNNKTTAKKLHRRFVTDGGIIQIKKSADNDTPQDRYSHMV